MYSDIQYPRYLKSVTCSIILSFITIFTLCTCFLHIAIDLVFVLDKVILIMILRTRFPPYRLFDIYFNVIQPSRRQRHYNTPKRRNKCITLKYAKHPIRQSYRKSKILSEHLKISTSNLQFNVAAKNTNPMKYILCFFSNLIHFYFPYIYNFLLTIFSTCFGPAGPSTGE